MEGVSNEAASLAGHQMLGNLCWFYDSNRVTIEGHTDLAFSDDVAARFLAYGWNVLRVGDVNDLERLGEAIEIFRRTKMHRRSLLSKAILAMAHHTNMTPAPRTASRLARKRCA